MRMLAPVLTLGLFTLLTARMPISGSRANVIPPRGATLHLAVGGELTAIDAASGRVRFSLPGGIASPDGRRLFTTTQVLEGTRLDAFDGRTGEVIASHIVPGSLFAGIASAQGRFFALTESADDPGPWLAPSRERTQLVVADAEHATHRRYVLDGNYAPEAFGARDDRLFVIEYLPALAPNRYRVRQLDLTSGQVFPVGGRTEKALPGGQKPVTVEEEMRGRGRTHVMAPDFSRLYTLYVHDDDHLHRRDYRELGGTGRPAEGIHAFVHVLSLTEGWAFCVDLPAPFGMGPAEAHSLALSPDGQRLAVVDASSGASIAIVNTETLQVVETRPNNAPDAYRPGSPTALAAGRDGTLYLGTGQELIALTRQGHVAYRRDLGEPIHALELSGDGAHIFAVSAGRLSVIDAASGDREAAFALKHVDGLALTARGTNGIAAPSRLSP